MKRITIIISLLFVLFANISFAQYYSENRPSDDSKRNLYERKVMSYTKMKKTGWTLTAVGGGMTILGIVLMSNSEVDYMGYPTETGGAIGMLSFTIGVPAAIGGIVLGSIGSRKQKEYMDKLNRLDVSFKKYKDQSTVKLVYRF